MRIPMEKATEFLRLMVEGMSVRSIERITGIHRDTILRLLLLAAEKITAKLRHEFESLVINRIQVDELHCFVQKRERMVSIEESDEVGEQMRWRAPSLRGRRSEQSRCIERPSPTTRVVRAQSRTFPS